MSARRCTATIVLALAVHGWPAPARAQGSAALPPEARLHLDVNDIAQLHTELLAVATKGVRHLLDEAAYKGAVTAYLQARERTKEPKVWAFLYDVCIEAGTIDHVRAAAARLPSDFTATEKEAAAKVLDALAAAWPRYEENEMRLRRRGHRVVVDGVLRRIFDGPKQDPLLSLLYGKMGFKPLEAPITAVIVAEAAEVGAWGLTSHGYYLIIPIGSHKGPGIVETIVHEATHLLDLRQPPGSASFLQRLRDKAVKADPAALDTLTHGLIAWNSGELVRRFIHHEYRPMVEVQPTWRGFVQRFLPTFEGPWAGYLDDKVSAADALDAMAAALRPAAGGDPQSGSP